MAKYEGFRDFINSRDIIEDPPSIKEIEKYLGIKLPKSYYDKGYWNNKKYAIGKILNEMNVKVKSVKTFVEFEKLDKKK